MRIILKHMIEAGRISETDADPVHQHSAVHSFCPTVLSVVLLVQCVVCRLSVCDVLYCGKTVRPSQTVSEGVNRKPGSKN